MTMRSSADALKGYANIDNPRGTLQQLANKLTYAGFTKGERNLDVNVQVDSALLVLHLLLSLVQIALLLMGNLVLLTKRL